MTEEGKVQAKRIKQLESEGFYVIKLSRTNKNGIMDIIALKPGENILFSEIKKKGGIVSPLQEYRKRELEGRGFKVELFEGK